jgi:hypothetical protein
MIESISMTNFSGPPGILCGLLALLLLGGCGETEVACDSSDTRNSVIGIVSADIHNALVGYAAKNSSAVLATLGSASNEAEKSAILEKAVQRASYILGDTISTNSKSKDRREVTCSALMTATVDDASAHKQVDFKVNRTADGKMSVSVAPFQFR